MDTLTAIRPMSTRQRDVLTAILVDGPRGWNLVVRGPEPAVSGSADAFLIGPGGVFGLLFSERPREEAVAHLFRERCAQLFDDLPIGNHRNVFVPETIEFVRIVAPHSDIRGDEGCRVVSALEWRSLLAAEPRMKRSEADRIAEAVTVRDRAYTRVSVDRSLASRSADDSGLLDVADLYEGDRTRALEKPFPTWMTFLDPAQRALATRNYNGPARIAGPAGSGKTVVALHRMAHRARRTTGKLLFTTFVRNLPPCQQRAFAQLAPDVSARAEFKNLHSWAGEFLARRDLPDRMDLRKADNAFNMAWSRVGSRGPLADIECDNRYWRDEIDRLIKGRGIAKFEEYAILDRRGRRGVLRRPAREAVWELYEQYESLRKRAGFLDANDLIAAALREILREPPDEDYAMVVVDEVQDMSVLGLRLVHALVGNTPNALLLVGDPQQQIYAGGWRLSEAGIPIVGRGETLKVNYRNCDAVLELATTLEGRNLVDDLDGAPGTTLSRSESVLTGGTAERWCGSDEDVENRVRVTLDSLAEAGIPLSDTALITRTNAEADRFRVALRGWGIEFRNLENYDGAEEDMIKIGTVYRAKGLDFRAVLHPYFAKSVPEDERGDSARDRADLAANQRFVAITRAREYVWLGIVANE
ncbi:UvrD-helicase domain-containing protein [Nocardia huaxiensis]|uniref:UvrD-helicase domain-containing protein n=1 Tax=Nocardia huaxiensis TaxID=2755382 RepID=UPI001E47F282|nr:UvrD-helicase domain-containing protein [Nocardia huaxiensis]UFS99599.1 UvrD-helicase domain-containing protein [Nocardia huaxiensis]